MQSDQTSSAHEHGGNMVHANTGKKRDANRTKGAILHAAITEFALRGPAGTRVDEVAARAGVNKSLIYQYFGSKQELYAEALSSVLATITEQSEQASRNSAGMAESGDLFGFVRAYLEEHLRLLEAVPEYPRLMAWENLEGGRTLARLPMQTMYRSFLDRVRQILEPAQQKGVLPKALSFEHVAQGVMALTHYYMIHRGTLLHLFQQDPNLPSTREGWLDFVASMFVGSFQMMKSGKPRPGV